MKVLKENLGGIVVLTLKGEFDTFVTGAFGHEITNVVAEGAHSIVLNMRLVKFVNSTALGAMIKARKQCLAAHGNLVISQPSPAVREAMESLGLDRLFQIFDDDENAVASVEGGGLSVDLEGESESAVILHVPDSPRPLVARIRRLDADTLECRLAAPGVKLAAGRDVRLKFRLPLYRKDFFDLTAKVDSVEDGPGGSTLALRFTRMSAEDRADIQKFLDDMGDLRRAARGT
jgi:anti-sigma B factor antagonist